VASMLEAPHNIGENTGGGDQIFGKASTMCSRLTPQEKSVHLKSLYIATSTGIMEGYTELD
jgi:hypothetical protein